MRVGASSKDIAPKENLPLKGQLVVRMSQYIHNPLTANAVFFENKGKKIVLVLCDLVGIPLHIVAEVQERCARRYGCACQAEMGPPCRTVYPIAEQAFTFPNS